MDNEMMQKNRWGGVSAPSKYALVTSIINKLSIKFGKFVRKILMQYAEHGNIKNKSKLWSAVELTKEQENEIQNFFRANYGKAFSSKWHRLYQSYTGVFRVDYFPEILFSTKLEPLMNPYDKAEFLCDKNLVPVLFGDIEGLHVPRTYFSCVNGLYRNEDKNYQNFDALITEIANIGSCVVKKTIDTSSGRDVMMCNFADGMDINSGLTVANVIEQFGTNFIVQERIKQHEKLAALNASSLNTFRVVTYLLNNKVYISPIALRLGRETAEFDNMHAGGMAIGVKENGNLRDTAFSEFGDRYYNHPDSGVIFKDYPVPEYNQIIEIAKKLHQRMPYLRVLSWDLSVDDESKVVLIEMNTVRQSLWFPQMVNGEPMFGENTMEMLKQLQNKS